MVLVATATASVRGMSRHAMPPASSEVSPSALSDRRDAEAAFEEGMRAYRDSAVDPAIQAFERAVHADPDMAAAHLRLGIFYAWFRRPADARDAFAHATAGRARLTPHDEAVLNAISLYVERVPPDFAEMHRRMAAGLDRFPDDGELLLLDTALYWETGEDEATLRSADRMIAKDVPFAEGKNFRGIALMRLGREDEALAAFERCAEGVNAETCLSNVFELHNRRGECDAAESDARREIAKSPSSQFGFTWLAQSLASGEKAKDAVLEALRQKWSRWPVASRAQTIASDEARVALWRGDFTTAIAKARHLEELVATNAERQDHADAAHLLVGALAESGNAEEAGERALEFLAHRDGWMDQPWQADTVMVEDPSPEMLGTAVRSGKMESTLFEQLREGWASRWRERAPPRVAPHIWFYAYGALSNDRKHALFALQAARDYAPLPSFRDLNENLALGRTYLLSGNTSSALGPLRAATRRCDALVEPIGHTRGFAALGRALEDSGDKAGACEAYGRVLARWRDAKPRSVTAEDMLSRVRVLGCDGAPTRRPNAEGQ